MCTLLLGVLALIGVAKWLNFVQDSEAQDAHDVRMDDLRREREGGGRAPDVLDEQHL